MMIVGSKKFVSIKDKRVWKKGMAHLRKNDRKIAEIIERMGYIELEWGPGDYHALVRSFISQQISGSAAESIYNKFIGLYSGRMPTPKEFLKTPQKRIRGVGISPQKYSYIKDLSQRIVSKKLSLEGLKHMPDDQVVERLDEVKGIGRWTAEMFLIFSLNRADVFPADDLGIIKAVQKVYGLRKMPERKKLDRLSEKWRPYRSVATIYLWWSLDSKKE